MATETVAEVVETAVSSVGSQRRRREACDWLVEQLRETTDGAAGWGWVADVPPNPQNTAEVVCALTTAGEPIPEPEKVLRLLETDTADADHKQDWSFTSVIDMGWRVRALQCMDEAGHMPEGATSTRDLAEEVREAKRPYGWSLTREGPGSYSPYATAVAVRALAAYPETRSCAELREGIELLTQELGKGDSDGAKLSDQAHAVAALSDAHVTRLLAGTQRRAVRRAVTRLLHRLDKAPVVEEEMFYREDERDYWRHLTLPHALLAILNAEPKYLLEPAFRRALKRLVGMQDLDGANRGGFRTSPEGFVTSYATTAAVEVLCLVDRAAPDVVDPAYVLDLVCDVRGEHHEDPQEIAHVGRKRMVLNSTAAFIQAVTVTVLCAALALLMFLFEEALPMWGMRIGAGAALVLVVASWAVYVMTYPRTNNLRVALGAGTVVTAVGIPLLAWWI
ncbi:hypothetical protein [Nesterenkonia alba]|uniref:hypothetical protein n=1 Tax=Nesterenkonia alba TaxID=515814 RepID=UPI0003B3F4E4|nr:hypothetical protein [Nesterenkonia alba]